MRFWPSWIPKQAPAYASNRTAREFHQSHECEGYRAKVTIEWSMPPHVDGDLLPPWRKEYAEQVADSILAFSGKRMREMVQAMRGYTPQRFPQATEDTP